MRTETIEHNHLEKHSVTVREKLSRYVAAWPLFLLSLMFCLGLAFFYTRYTSPKYLSQLTFLVKNGDNSQPKSEDLIEAAMNGRKQINLNNEILLLKSGSLLQQAVQRGNFNIQFYVKGRLLMIELYKDMPFEIIFEKKGDPVTPLELVFNEIKGTGGKLKEAGEKNAIHSFRWNEPIQIKDWRFALKPKHQGADIAGEYSMKYTPAEYAANEMLKNLIAEPYDQQTNAIKLSLKTENLGRGNDFLNALFDEFNQSDVNERNRLSDSTVKFIDDRLIAITNELKGVEGNLEDYQGSKQLVDIRNQSAQSLERTSDIQQSIKQINVQQGVVNMITEYFSDPANKNKLIPATLGITDPTLMTLITKYNEVQLKKERESPMLASKRAG